MKGFLKNSEPIEGFLINQNQQKAFLKNWEPLVFLRIQNQRKAFLRSENQEGFRRESKPKKGLSEEWSNNKKAFPIDQRKVYNNNSEPVEGFP